MLKFKLHVTSPAKYWLPCPIFVRFKSNTTRIVSPFTPSVKIYQPKKNLFKIIPGFFTRLSREERISFKASLVLMQNMKERFPLNASYARNLRSFEGRYGYPAFSSTIHAQIFVVAARNSHHTAQNTFQYATIVFEFELLLISFSAASTSTGHKRHRIDDECSEEQDAFRCRKVSNSLATCQRPGLADLITFQKGPPASVFK